MKQRILFVFVLGLLLGTSVRATARPVFAATKTPKILLTTPLLSLSINVPATAKPGDTVTATLSVKNTDASIVARHVAAAATLPSGLNFSDEATSVRTKSWDLSASLVGDESKSTTFHIVVPKLAKPKVYVLEGRASADNYDPVTATAKLSLVQPQVLGATTELPKTGTPSFVALGIVVLGSLLLAMGAVSLYAMRNDFR